MVESYDNLLAVSHEINANSLIAGISCNITNVANKDSTSDSDIAIGVTEAYHALLEKETFLIMHDMGLYKDNGHVTVLLSALVNETTIDCITDLFKKFGQCLMSYHSLTQWQMRILTTKMNQFTLVNMLLTNNNEPQLIVLGDNLATLLKLTLLRNDATQSEYQRILKPLLQVRYLLNTDKVSDVYQHDLINLDNNVDMSLLMKHIDSKFQEFLKQELITRYTAKSLFDNTNDVLKEIASESFRTKYRADYYYKKMTTPDILVLDLNWFISHLTNFTVSYLQLLTEVPTNIKDIIQYWLQQIQ